MGWRLGNRYAEASKERGMSDSTGISGIFHGFYAIIGAPRCQSITGDCKIHH